MSGKYDFSDPYHPRLIKGAKMSKKDPTIDDVMSSAMTITHKAGSALVQAGLARLKDDYNANLVQFVAGTMNQITRLQTIIDETQQHIAFQKERLQAINDGEFTVNPHGHIRFNKGELNASLP